MLPAATIQDLAYKLPAGGIDIATAGPSSNSSNPSLLKYRREAVYHRIFRSTIQSIWKGIERDKIHLGWDVLQKFGQ